MKMSWAQRVRSKSKQEKLGKGELHAQQFKVFLNELKLDPESLVVEVEKCRLQRESQAEAEALEKCEAEALEQRRSRSRNSFPKKPVVEQDELELGSDAMMQRQTSDSSGISQSYLQRMDAAFLRHTTPACQGALYDSWRPMATWRV
eukprot:g7312.t1